MREALDAVSGAVSAVLSSFSASRQLEQMREELADLRWLERVGIIRRIRRAERAWLESLDDLTAAEARLREEQEKSLMVTNAELVAIERLEDQLWLAGKAYAQGTISAAALGLAQDELNQAIEDSTAPTRDEEAAKREVERLTADTLVLEQEMNDLKERQAGLAQEILEAELAVLDAALAQVLAQLAMVDAAAELGGLTDAQLTTWTLIAEQAGVTRDTINDMLGLLQQASDATIPLLGGGAVGAGTQALNDIYSVVRGDTLSQIARQFGVGLDALIAANPQISNPNLIHPGDQINIPSTINLTVRIDSTFPSDNDAVTQATVEAIVEGVRQYEAAKQ